MNVGKIKLHKIFSLIFIFNLIVVLCSCKQEEIIQNEFIPKPDTLMPNYTDTGANVLAFRINGRMVISEDRIQRTRGFAAGFFIPVNTDKYLLFIDGGYIASNRSEGIRINIENIVDTGIYILKESNFTNHNQGQYYAGPTPYYGVVYTTRDHLKGHVHLRNIDTINYIVSGTFEFEAKRFNYFGPENDSVLVTEGRFDFKYE